MENKKVLGKIIPAVFVLVLALVLVIIISSCSKGKKTPTGAIVDEENYLKIDIADNKSYSVSKLEFYNKLRYVGYDVFEDALYEAALIDIVNDIRKDIEDNGSNFESMKYSKKFKYVIDSAVYGSADKDEIDKIEDKDKVIREKSYINGLKQNGYTVDYEKGIYQKASLESMTITLAKREFARKKLLKEMEDVDSENQITKKSIEDYFTNKLVDKGDMSALLILLSSQTEITDTLKQLNLKFAGNKVYRVVVTQDIADKVYGDPTNPKFSEYEDYYDNDFSTTASGVAELDPIEVLFEFARVYNYVFPYKTQLKFEIDGEDYLDTTKYPTNTLGETYTDAIYKKIKEYSLDDAIANLLAQDTGDNTTRLNYTKDILNKIDTTLQTEISKNYRVASAEHNMYNTPSSTYSRGNYLVFKLKDGYNLEYKGVEALANLQNSIEGGDETIIKGHIECVKEEFTDILKGLKIYDNSEEVKKWALDYASKITAFGITGANNIIASTKDQKDENSIFYMIFETLLTDDYINEKLDEYLDDECKIYIYDQLFEVQFAQKHEFYKTGNKQSKTDVLKVKVKKEDSKEYTEYSITAEEMFTRLNNKYGAVEATFSLGNQVLKDLYNDRITDAKKKEYEEEYETIIAYFAQGNSTQYGYSPSIGQKAFVNLYFRADNKEDAIFNMWVASELQNILLYENPTVTRTDMISIFDSLTGVSYDNYAHINYNIISVYTDDDEDGKADDWSKVDDSDPRKIEVKELSAKLINLINERTMDEFSNSNRDTAYNSLATQYKSASRISHLGNYGDGQPLPTFTTTTEKESYYFAQFKSKGILVSVGVEEDIEDGIELSNLDDNAYEMQIREMYKYMIVEHKDDLDVDQIIARKVETNDDGNNIDKVTSSNLFSYESGYATIYILKTTKAPSFKFEYKDNEDTSTGSKVYPYSTNEDNPFPLDPDGKPYDNSKEEDTLYNSNDTVSQNQIIVYVREYNDGVESLKLSVVDSFKAYFEKQVMDYYTSENFRYYIFKCLIDQYKAEGKLSINDELMEKVNSFVEAKNESLFGFKTTETSEKWYEYFK